VLKFKELNLTMKIVTVNIPEPYINAIDKLTGYEGGD